MARPRIPQTTPPAVGLAGQPPSPLDGQVDGQVNGHARPAPGRRGPDAGDRLPAAHREPDMRPVGEGSVNEPCPACRRTGLQSMAFRLKNGDTAQMRRCGRCEWKAWSLDGRQVSLAELLTTVQDAGLPRASRKRSTA